jgi:Heparinase II/III-like protein
VAALTAAALTAWPAGASAGTVTGLRTASCPPDYAVLKVGKYSKREVADARDGLFHVHKTTRRLVPPVKWRQNPYHSLAFQAELQDLSWVSVLFYAYQNNGDVAALAQARDLLLDWVRHNRKRGKRATTPRTWFDKVVGDRAPYLAYLTRAASCEGLLSDKQANVLLKSLKAHGSFLSDPGEYTNTNRGLYMDTGLVLLSQQLPFMLKAASWRQVGETRFAANLHSHTIPGEGFWLEHSSTYQILVTKLVERFLDIPGTDDPGLADLHSQLKNTSGWLVEPDEENILLGNSNFTKVGDDLVEEASNDQGMRILPRSGLAFVKQQDPAAYLSVAATFFSDIHKHSDDLTFDLFEQGHRIVSDSGLFSKDPGPWYAFSRSSRAHSVLTVDDVGFPRKSKLAYGSGIVASGQGDGWFAIQGTNPLVGRQGVDHNRLFLYKPGVGLIVVDRVRSGKTHKYRRFIQLGRDVEIERAADQILLHAKDFDGTLFSASTAGPGKVRTFRGDRDPINGFVFPEFRERNRRWTVRYQTKGSNVDHVTTLGLDSSEPVRAVLVGPAADAGTTVQVSAGGAPLYDLRVVRVGGSLQVTQSPP